MIDWNIEALTGYVPKTTFYTDFSIADRFGTAAIEDTYRRAFKLQPYAIIKKERRISNATN